MMRTHHWKTNVTLGGMVATVISLFSGLINNSFHMVEVAIGCAAVAVLALVGIRIYEIIKY